MDALPDTPRARFDLSDELTACSRDIVTPCFARNGEQAGARQALAKIVYRRFRRAAITTPGEGVEGDQIDFRRQPFQQPHHRLRVSRAVVNVLQHDVLEGDFAVRIMFRVSPAGSGEFR